MANKLVVHYLDGRLLKGYSTDFFPHKEVFFLDDVATGDRAEVRIDELKAIFFVKSFEGRDGFETRDDLDRPGFGKRIQVRFKDGETMAGYTSGYSENRRVFFLFPADPDDNNDRIAVVNAATEEVKFL